MQDDTDTELSGHRQHGGLKRAYNYNNVQVILSGLSMIFLSMCGIAIDMEGCMLNDGIYRIYSHIS